MKKRHFLYLGLAAAALLLLAGVLLGVASHNAARQKEGEQVFATVHDFALGFPENMDTYGFAAFYHCDGTSEYLILQNGEHRICGVRPAGAATPDSAVYYMGGKSWQINSAGELAETGIWESPVEEIAKAVIHTLMNDESLSFTCQKSKANYAPLWIDYNQDYLACQRSSYGDCSEIMACVEGALQWNIAKDSHNAVIFLYAGAYRPQPESIPRVQTWGDVDEAVCKALFSEISAAPKSGNG